MTKITLIGTDGSIHAEGIIELANIINCHLVEHNKRLYYFKSPSHISNHIFEECSQPYVITEF